MKATEFRLRIRNVPSIAAEGPEKVAFLFRLPAVVVVALVRNEEEEEEEEDELVEGFEAGVGL